MKAYIKSSSSINPCGVFSSGELPAQIPFSYGDYLKCIEPDYKNYISPTMIRRMGRVVKMGVTAAIQCLKDAGVEQPAAIITGTGLGCIEDTENFLGQIIKNKEQFLPPTSFIQSTHNTIAGQIALLLACNAYNFTYVHRNLSFEHALLDALMKLEEEPGNGILLGGIDEITPASFTIMKRLGLYRKQNEEAGFSDGAVAGEGASFFYLSSDASGAQAAICDVAMLHKLTKKEDFRDFITGFLQRNNLKTDDVSLLLSGINSDKRYAESYECVHENYFSGIPIIPYKMYCGEYFTSSAFATWLAASVIKGQQMPLIPDTIKRQDFKAKHALIYNYFLDDHALILVSEC